MPLTLRLTAKIRDALGPEAAEDLMNWMESTEERHREQRELHELAAARIDARFDQAKAELRTEISELRREMQVGFATISGDIDRRFGEVIKWSFVFWSTTLLTLLAALGVMRYAAGVALG